MKVRDRRDGKVRERRSYGCLGGEGFGHFCTDGTFVPEEHAEVVEEAKPEEKELDGAGDVILEIGERPRPPSINGH